MLASSIHSHGVMPCVIIVHAAGCQEAGGSLLINRSCVGGNVAVFMISALTITNDFYAGWGTLSLVNAGIAQGKGRSGLNWFLLSLLGGPLAT